MTERTKAELLKEIEELKTIIDRMTKAQISVIDNACGLNRTIVRYQAKMHRIDRISARQMRICLLFILIVNTILLALGWG